MNEPIKLKVPSGGVMHAVTTVDPETKEAVTKKVPVEYVSQGNYDAELKPNSIIETTSQPFADYLASEYGLKIINPPPVVPGDDSGNPPPRDFEAEYPADYPKREIFIGREMPFETARGLAREQLVTISGIKDKTADSILAWQPAPVAPVQPEAGSEENNGGQE